jgi:hypothetical protein
MNDLGFVLTESEGNLNDELFGEAPTPPTPRRGKPTKVDELVSEIEMFYMAIGATLMASDKTQADGMVIMQSAPKIAEAWRDPINRNSKIKAMWGKMFAAQGYSGLLMAHLPIAAAIAQNHNLKIRLPFKQKPVKEVVEDDDN